MPEKPLSRRVVSAGGRILRATRRRVEPNLSPETVSYTHLRAHET